MSVASIPEEKIIRLIKDCEEMYASLHTERIIIYGTHIIAKLPKPLSLKPTFLIGNKEVSLEEAVCSSNKSLDVLISTTRDRYKGLLGKRGSREEMHLREGYLIVKQTNTLLDENLYFENAKDDTRKYEIGPKSIHAIKTQLMLPQGAPFWTHLTSLGHDTIEDSYELSLLEKLLNLRIRPKERKTLEDLFPGIENNLDDAFSRIANYVLAKRSSSKENQEIITLTKPPKVPYISLCHGLTLIQNPETAYWDGIIKLDDRGDNAHFNPFVTSVEGLKENGPKLFKDGLKNCYALEAAKQIFLQLLRGNHLSDQYQAEITDDKFSMPDYLARMYGLAALNNKNMNFLMRKLREYSQDMKLTYKSDTMHLLHWFDLLEAELCQYFQDGGFRYMDQEAHAPDDLLEFRGSLKGLDEFLNGQRKELFGDMEDPKERFRLYKYATVIKAMSCLYLSHYPWDGSCLMKIYTKDPYDLDTMGNFDRKLYVFRVEGFLE